jgi:hypothetical protein
MGDSEPLEGTTYSMDKGNDERPDTMTSLFGEIAKKISWKIALFVFVLVLLIWSDVFIENIMTKFDGLVEGRMVSQKGTIVQATVLTLAVIVLSFLISVDVL